MRQRALTARAVKRRALGEVQIEAHADHAALDEGRHVAVGGVVRQKADAFEASAAFGDRLQHVAVVRAVAAQWVDENRMAHAMRIEHTRELVGAARLVG